MPRVKKDGTEAKKTGPKRKYTPEELRAKVDAYITACEKKGTPPLFPRMLLYLDISRSTKDNWCKADPAYAEVFDYAQLNIEASLLEIMVSDNKRAQGCLNALKQKENGGYVDRPQTDGENKVTINLVGVGGVESAK
ncbi:MAG: hypothetical protein J6Y20_03565 [Lachnospiraceae bacterium]|nr:hypothetical protein [Lachnospiraceae bacterium]